MSTPHDPWQDERRNPPHQSGPRYSYPDAHYAQGGPESLVPENYPQPDPYYAPYPPLRPAHVSHRSRILAALLALFLGTLGIHNFYLGFIGRGLAQLLITVFTLGFGAVITAIWAIIEAILLLVNTQSIDAEGRILQ